MIHVSFRGRASGGEDEKVGSKVCPSPPCASNRAVGNPTGEFSSTLFRRAGSQLWSYNNIATVLLTSKLPLPVRETSWLKSVCAAASPCLKSSWHASAASCRTPFGVGRRPPTAWCMWTSVWSSTASGAPCSLSTASLWARTSLQQSK